MNRALFIGRFQPFHNAHLLDVKKILEEADEVIIAIGSSQEKGTLLNPFSYLERKKMIDKALKKENIKNYRVFPVPDSYNDGNWIVYIRKNLPSYDVVYSGNPLTLECFRRHDSAVKKISLIEGISSTIIRDSILKGGDWKNIVPVEVSRYIDSINGVERVRKINTQQS